METSRLRALLEAIRRARVAVFGDFCLDAYWQIDPALAEISLETGKRTLPVREQRYSPGGAGNIVANLAALGVDRVCAVGVIGDDLFGQELLRLLAALGVDTRGILKQGADWATPVYAKPYVGDEEQSRLDFGVCNQLSAENEERVIIALADILPQVQGVILNQQLPRGVNTPRVIAGLNALVVRHPHRFFIADVRDASAQYQGVIFRLNVQEAARLCGRSVACGAEVPAADCARLAAEIAQHTGKPVFISRGEQGALVFWAGRAEVIAPIPARGPTDPVGAGDTSVAAIAAALAAGASPSAAAELANLAAAVTVRKLKMTGTATPAEILAIASESAR